MSWKLFLPMLIAACLLGHPVRAPRLREAIPEFADPRCDYAGARDLYLTAYAYSREIPEVAMKFALSAEQELADGRTIGLLSLHQVVSQGDAGL